MAAPMARKQSGNISASEKSLRLSNKVRKHFCYIASYVEDICPNLANFYSVNQRPSIRDMGEWDARKSEQIQKQIASNLQLTASTSGNSSRSTGVKQIEDEGTETKTTSNEGHCPYCNKPYKPGNFHTRLLPKPKLTGKIQKLLPRYTSNPRSLGKFQQKLVENYIEGQNILVTTCLVCKKKVKQKGQTRVERENQKTPKQLEKFEKRDEEVKVLSAREKKQERKREKKKAMKQRKRDGGGDVNAGLTLPFATSLTLSQENSTETLSSATSVLLPLATSSGTLAFAKVSCERAHAEDHTSSTELSPLSPWNSKKAKEETKTEQPPPELTTSPPSKNTFKHQKHKQSSFDLNKVLAMKNMKHANFSSTSVITKKKKKKQLGQTLGLILKQEKNKKSEGSLTDFLSSL